MTQLRTGAAFAALLALAPLGSGAQPDAGPAPPANPAAEEDQGDVAPMTPAPPAEGRREGEVSGPVAPPWGPGAFPPGFGPAAGGLPHADYRATWFPDESVAGQATKLGYVEQDVSVGFPLWHCGADDFGASVGVRDELFHTHAVLPTTGQPFPDDLWNVRLGASYRHDFENGWTAGGSANVGSASDRPFHGIDEMTAGVNAFLRVPSGEHNAWLFSLAYSPTSELPFPIPGVAFLYQPSDRFRANLGLPFQLRYRPLDDLTLDFSYMLLRTVHARATYRLCDLLWAYGGFDWSNESYFLADRPDTRDRFFSYDKRLSGGVEVPLGGHVLLGLAGGYVFDRFYFEGRSYSDRHFNRVDVAPGPFLSFEGKVRW
jgi:hypothetical protein